MPGTLILTICHTCITFNTCITGPDTMTTEVYDHEKMIADKAAKDVASMQKTTEEKKAAKKENKKDKA
jgi:hypothetical protein